jgi:hypothetical protein
MGRPKQDLNKWCNTNVDFKFEFLDQECRKADGLVQYIRNNYGYTFIGDSQYLKQQIPQEVLPSFQQAILGNGLAVHVSLECFNQLKKKFIQYKKEKTKSHLIKKQYLFNKELSANVQHIKNVNGWKREEIVIEYLVNGYLNQKTQYTTKVEIETKSIKLKMLNDEINKNLSVIRQLKDEAFELKQKLLKETSAKEHFENLCKEHGIDGGSPQLSETYSE